MKFYPRGLIIVGFLFYTVHTSVAQEWTHCVTSNCYDATVGDKTRFGVKKPFVFCYNSYAFGFKVDGRFTICRVGRSDRTISPGGFAQEDFLCSESVGENYGDYIVTIVYSSPAEVTINYGRFGGYSYHFKTRDLPSIRETIKSGLVGTSRYKLKDREGRWPDPDPVYENLDTPAIAIPLSDYVKGKVKNICIGDYPLAVHVGKSGKPTFFFGNSPNSYMCNYWVGVALSGLNYKPAILNGEPVASYVVDTVRIR